ncbi:MAG: hypothetical protein BWK80_00870 [Desulfobacteraceae bacterium IS3]|nr:MAG: hypothetical protein BWK80_00870 [Desulfobacteraceae bacterium IS3]
MTTGKGLHANVVKLSLNPPLRGAGGCLRETASLRKNLPAPETPPCPPQGGISKCPALNLMTLWVTPPPSIQKRM